MKDIVHFVNDIRPNIFGFDKLFDDIILRPSAYLHGEAFPKDNIIHQDNTIIIELALSGYSKEDISIERDGNFLEISAKKVDREEDENVTYVRRNIAMRAFTKRYPVAAEYKDIRARLKDGILSIHLEKEAEEETKHLIEIS